MLTSFAVFATLLNKLRSKRFHFAACLFAFSFLLIESTALAHELRHDLNQHDDASCVLHLYAEHLGKTSNVDATITLLTTEHETIAAAITPVMTQSHTGHYLSRAPPYTSTVQIV